MKRLAKVMRQPQQVQAKPRAHPHARTAEETNGAQQERHAPERFQNLQRSDRKRAQVKGREQRQRRPKGLRHSAPGTEVLLPVENQEAAEENKPRERKVGWRGRLEPEMNPAVQHDSLRI